MVCPITGSRKPDVISSMKYNETRHINVTFNIPKYVEVGRRFQIGVTALLYKTDPYSGQEEEEEEEERKRSKSPMVKTDFFFMVSNGSLSGLDPDEPSCHAEVAYEGLEECSNVTDSADCGSFCWGAKMAVRDAGSGIRATWTREENATLAYGWGDEGEGQLSVGTRQLVPLTLASSCCRTSLEVEVEDLAGNVATCTIGQVENDAFNVEPGAISLCSGVLLMTSIHFVRL